MHFFFFLRKNSKIPVRIILTGTRNFMFEFKAVIKFYNFFYSISFVLLLVLHFGVSSIWDIKTWSKLVCILPPIHMLVSLVSFQYWWTHTIYLSSHVLTSWCFREPIKLFFLERHQDLWKREHMFLQTKIQQSKDNRDT